MSIILCLFCVLEPSLACSLFSTIMLLCSRYSPDSSLFSLKLQVMLSRHDNEMSRRLMRILKKPRESDPSYYQLCYLVRQGEQPREGLLLHVNLHEDQMGSTGGYIDRIMQIHRQVQQNAWWIVLEFSRFLQVLLCFNYKYYSFHLGAFSI